MSTTATLSDAKSTHYDGEVGYTTRINTLTDYYPFGMMMSGRSFEETGYGYGFQGQEKDDEIKGEGNSINYKYRMHDARVGRFFAVDPLALDYPFYCPYSFSGNKVIAYVELEGLEEYPINVGSPWSLIEQGFSNFFGGIVFTIESITGSVATLKTSTGTTTSTEKKLPGDIIMRSSVSVSKETEIALSQYFLSYGSTGVDYSVDSESTTSFEKEVKYGKYQLDIAVELDEKGKPKVSVSADFLIGDVVLWAQDDGSVGVDIVSSVSLSSESSSPAPAAEIEASQSVTLSLDKKK
ncbi:MAG: hypothetical protein GC193_10495 [Cryomorphaceae bacterium]|nr:hypothetical protein [Cryomorphaceae bacterium]